MAETFDTIKSRGEDVCPVVEFLPRSIPDTVWARRCVAAAFQSIPYFRCREVVAEWVPF